jgi:hypothetical protein
MTKVRTFWVILALLAVSCTSRYTYLAPDQKAYWNTKPCLSLQKKDLQYHAFIAVLYSAYVHKWAFTRIDSAEFMIEAGIGKGKFAPEMIIAVAEDGVVMISRKAFSELSKEEMRLIKRQMADFEKTFDRHRCESIETLEKQIKRFRAMGGG